MLLSKSEKKYNLIYIISLIITVISFYLNVLSDYKLIIGIVLTTLLLFLLNLMRYNTFKRPLKKITAFLYYVFIIWMICNKIYFTFFGDYINLTRIFSASAPSIIASAVFNVIKSLSLVILLVFSIINLYTFKKSKFRFKQFKKITVILFLFYAVMTLCLRTYTYEILASIATSSFKTDTENDIYKPVTSERVNEFDFLLNKKHENNTYTSIAKDRNLILVQCESLQNVMLNKTYNNGSKEYEITPNLNKLIKDNSLYFNNCFAQIGWGNTSDAEFIVNNSFYPLAMQSIYQRCVDNSFYGLPKILNKNGYSTSVYHGYVADMWNRDKFYPVEGFNKYLSSTSYPTNEYIGFGIADRPFFKQTVNYISEEQSPFYSFIITLSSHTPFNTSDAMSDIVLSKQDQGSMFGNYIININYLDSAIGIFLDELKAKGLYDNSIIIFYGDHHGLNRSDADNYKHMTSFLGKPYQYDDMLNIPFIIHIPGLGNSETIETTCGQIDFMPTILNLLGIENDSIYFGEDVLSIDKNSDRAIGGGTYMPTGSYINKDYIFIMSDDSIYEHATIIDRKTGGASEKIVSRDNLYKKSKEIQNYVKVSNTITEKNILEALLNNDQIIMNDVNPQPIIFNFNNDKDEYNYIERLKEVTDAGFNLLAVKVYEKDDEFYVNNPMNVFNKCTLVEFLEEVNKIKDTYIILTDVKDIEEDLFRYLGKEYPKLSQLCIPEIYSFDGYNLTKTFNLNTPILSLDDIDCKDEELISFIANNKLFAVLSSSDNFKAKYINLISKTYKTFSYVKSVNESGEITYYKNKAVNGFYTDNINLIKNFKKIAK